ncbi:hypothetical protein [Nocardioides litoris]|uniref:hypothetical protein n=1 Tax=Nocardioides litoris TaxID=1926648 RepID=UPI001120F126|nr:hypothetical protein [Nocardioides litoris]
MPAKRHKWDRLEHWCSYPVRPLGRGVVPAHVLDVVGMQVDEAARVVNAAGWLVRALAPGAPVFLDLVPSRLDLVFDRDRNVVDVSVG